MLQHVATEEEQHELFKYSRARVGSAIALVNVEDPRTGVNALLFAAELGIAPAVSALVGLGANINHSNQFGITALYTASSLGFTDVIDVLLSGGADVGLCQQDGSSPVFVAAQEGQAASLRLLMNTRQGQQLLNTPRQDGMTPLHIASWSGYEECVRILLDVACSSISDAACSTPAPAVEAIKPCQDHVPFVDAVDREGDTPLHLACYQGHIEIVKILLDPGHASVDSRNLTRCTVTGKKPHGNATPLHTAARSSQQGAVDCLRLLLSAGASINATDAAGLNPLQAAIERGNREGIIAIRDYIGARTAANVAPSEIERVANRLRHAADGSSGSHSSRHTLKRGSSDMMDTDLDSDFSQLRLQAARTSEDGCASSPGSMGVHSKTSDDGRNGAHRSCASVERQWSQCRAAKHSLPSHSSDDNGAYRCDNSTSLGAVPQPSLPPTQHIQRPAYESAPQSPELKGHPIVFNGVAFPSAKAAFQALAIDDQGAALSTLKL